MIGTAVQKALHDALKASPSLAGGRVYDHIPRGRDGAITADFPFVAIGDEQDINDDNSCSDGWEVYADVHVWSRAVGYPEAKEIAATVAARIRSIGSVAGYELISVTVEDSRFLRDPDGLTSHAVITAHFILDPA